MWYGTIIWGMTPCNMVEIWRGWRESTTHASYVCTRPRHIPKYSTYRSHCHENLKHYKTVNFMGSFSCTIKSLHTFPGVCNSFQKRKFALLCENLQRESRSKNID
jgi:hypothetical protein